MHWLGGDSVKGLPIVAVDLGDAYVTRDATDPTTIVIGTRRQAIELRLRGDLLHALTMLTELAGCSRAVYRSVTGGDQRPASPAMGPNTFGSPVDLDQII